jgi:hypothetical protein
METLGRLHAASQPSGGRVQVTCTYGGLLGNMGWVGERLVGHMGGGACRSHEWRALGNMGGVGGGGV